MDVLEEVARATVYDLISIKGKRIDGRGFDEYRKISVQTGVVASAEGSALVHLGNTQVLAAVKFDLAEPFPDRPDEGIMSTSAELLPLASPTFEPGPPDENAIELARVVDRGIRASEIFDLKKFYIEEGKVLGMFIDIYVLDYDGNLVDASGLAAMAALRDAKVPLYEDGTLIRDPDKMKPLELSGDVMYVTFARVGDTIIVDPNGEEELGANGRITFGILNGDHVVAVQKSGNTRFAIGEIDELIDRAMNHSKHLMESIKNRKIE